MNESKRKKEHKVSFLNNLFSVISRCRYSKLMPPQELLFHVAVYLCPNIEMAQRAFTALWAIFVLLNVLTAIVVFRCLEFFLFRFPFCELSLPLFALVVCHDIGKESASDAFDGMLRNVSVVNEFFTSTQEFLLHMLVVEFEGVLGVFGVCVRHHSFRFVVWKKQTLCQARACIGVCVS